MGGWTWYTGAAGWIYRVWTEDVLGLKVRGSFMTVEPVIPAGWEGFSLVYRRGRAEYQVTVKNPDRVSRGVVTVEMDGQALEDRRIPLVEDVPGMEPRVRHDVLVVMGEST
jgi:cyclic beta-1,2-glucan synthetase